MRRRMQHLWFTRRWALLFVSVLLGVAISCSEGVVTSEGARAALPSHVKAVADGNRPMPGTVSPEVLMSQFAELLYEYGDFSDEAPATLVRYDPDPIGVVDAPVAQISIDQAIEETRLLFAVLKYGYAGYRFFGGDEAFGAARESILSRIGRDTGFIATEELLELMVDCLGFVQDGHFAIGSRALCKRFRLYADFSIEFVRNDKGEFVAIDGRTLARVDSCIPSDYMKASISAAGDIVYVPGLLVPSDAQSAGIVLEFGDGSRQSVQLSPVRSETPETRGLPYELTDLEGIPLAKCRAFLPVGDSRESMDMFVRDAERLWYESVVILDLRSNRGGDEMFAKQWCLRLTLKNPGPLGAGAELKTSTAMILRDNTKRRLGIGPEDGQRRSPPDPNNPGWSVIGQSSEVFAANKPVLVVLMDSYCASATEGLIDYLRHMDNVVFMGINTSGAYQTGNVGMFVLPHSRLGVWVPTLLKLNASGTSIDGIGFLPDFWVAPECILERAAAFIRRHLLSS